MRINHTSAEICRKIADKATIRARDNCYRANIQDIHKSIHYYAKMGIYKYKTSLDEYGHVDAHLVDCIKKHFTALGFSVIAEYHPSTTYTRATYYLTFSWEAKE